MVELNKQDVEKLIQLVMRRLGYTRQKAIQWLARYLKSVGNKPSKATLEAAIGQQKTKDRSPFPPKLRPDFEPNIKQPSPDDEPSPGL